MEKIKVRVWDSKLLNDTFVTTTQIKAHIETLIQQVMTNPLAELPHSMVPTQTLYEIVLCNDLMYNLLLDKELIETGNKKTDRTKIH
jgi:hypothetical protein